MDSRSSVSSLTRTVTASLLSRGKAKTADVGGGAATAPLNRGANVVTLGLVVVAKRKTEKEKEEGEDDMKNRLLLLAVAVLGTSVLAHAVTPPTDGFCSHASGRAITVINFLLSLLGQGPIC
jgi:hypothetical protein